MIPVTLEYKPFGIFPSRRKTVQLPTRWKEVSASHLIAIANRTNGDITAPDVLHLFLGIGKRLARRLDEYQGFSISQYVKFIESVEIHDSFIIPSVKGYKAPPEKLKDVVFAAFMFGDTYFQNYLLKGEEEDLNKFIACYYHKGSFREDLIDRTAEKISQAELNVRKAIALNYILIREWLAKAYSYVFRKDESKKNKKDNGWLAVFDAVVGDDISNQEKYANQSMHQVLRFLNRKTKEYYRNGS